MTLDPRIEDSDGDHLWIQAPTSIAEPWGCTGIGAWGHMDNSALVEPSQLQSPVESDSGPGLGPSMINVHSITECRVAPPGCTDRVQLRSCLQVSSCLDEFPRVPKKVRFSFAVSFSFPSACQINLSARESRSGSLDCLASGHSHSSADTFVPAPPLYDALGPSFCSSSGGFVSESSKAGGFCSSSVGLVSESSPSHHAGPCIASGGTNLAATTGDRIQPEVVTLALSPVVSSAGGLTCLDDGSQRSGCVDRAPFVSPGTVAGLLPVLFLVHGSPLLMLRLVVPRTLCRSSGVGNGVLPMAVVLAC